MVDDKCMGSLRIDATCKPIHNMDGVLSIGMCLLISIEKPTVRSTPSVFRRKKYTSTNSKSTRIG